MISYDRNLCLKEADEKLTKSHPIMTAYPRHAKLAGQSAIATLYYSCLYHYDLPPVRAWLISLWLDDNLFRIYP